MSCAVDLGHSQYIKPKGYIVDFEGLLKELNLTEAQIEELQQTLQTNPMAAMGLVQKFNISPQTLQKIMAFFMSNPQAFESMAKTAGVPSETLDTIKGKLEEKD